MIGLKKYIGTLLLLLLATTSAFAQKAERDYIRKGNRAYKDSVYVDAEVNYRKALEANPKSTVSMFNLGNTLLQQNKVQEAMEQYVGAARVEKDKMNLAQIYHNMGVIFHAQKDYAKAVEAYKESLRNNPKDDETRYNLALAQKMLKESADKSFNMMTVDGDTSTNDSLFLLANGASGVAIETEEDKAAFAALLDEICIDMARRIASDGEGATHLMIVEAYGLPTEKDAKLVARSIAGSSLFKAALFGKDANWGRIMAAAGYSGADVDPTKADCILKSAAGEVVVMQDGFGTDFSEELAKQVLTEHDVTVVVDFHSGDGQATAFGCDLTYDYVKINGDYRT